MQAEGTSTVLASAHSQESMEDKVELMIREALTHPAVKNEFYDTWMSRRLTAPQVEVFARNFYARSRYSAQYIAMAFLQIDPDDLAERTETAENLLDETGNGNPQKTHFFMLREFLELLLSKLRAETVTFDDISGPLLRSTTELIKQGESLFTSSSRQQAYGALLAKEWHAYSQLVYIYEGVRNYIDLFDLTEFHESCEYFYVHIGSVEKEHRFNSQKAAARMCRNDDDFAELRTGFLTYLDLLAANWQEIHDSMLGV
jgi:hypothetical protein